jgi:RNA polymerase sigma-70 factor (ECF subfamily)
MSKSNPELNEVHSSLLAAARGGDQNSFEQLVEPYRRELLVHSYRFLGSFEDAEDVLQETLLRAWRRLDSFEGRSTFRAWLYKIATNASLDAIDSRKKRAMSTALYPRGEPLAPLPQPIKKANWVEPLPDELVDNQPAVYPEARYEIRESIMLAFVAALQHLPGRQRAVLLLRDVLGWNTIEIAGMLSMTPVAVNSVLQRARVTMQQHWDSRRERQSARLDDELKTALLQRYMSAWEAADSNALIDVMREDVALTMPPFPVWFGGRSDVQAFLDGFIFKMLGPQPARLRATRANGCPAFVIYQADAEGVYRPVALQVLSLDNGLVAEINDFLYLDERMFSRFGVPITG